MGVTDSSGELYGAIRTRLLTYTDGGAAPNTIAAATTSRVYSGSPPDPASNTQQTVPFVLLTVTIVPNSIEGDRTRFEFDVEVQIVHRPRISTIPAALRIADLATKALVGRVIAASSTDGFVQMKAPTVRLLPAGGGDADRTVVQILVATSGYGYSKMLAAALT